MGRKERLEVRNWLVLGLFHGPTLSLDRGKRIIYKQWKKRVWRRKIDGLGNVFSSGGDGNNNADLCGAMSRMLTTTSPPVDVFATKVLCSSGFGSRMVVLGVARYGDG